MGGAIAQELAIRHPAVVNDLVLFSTFPGGMFGIPAPWSVLRRLFEIEGLTPEEAARQVWPVTYSPEYLASHLAEVEAQMHREIVYPTPEHAARGQSAAIRAFSSTFRLSEITARTLVATGDADKLVPPGNSRILCGHIPDAHLAIFPNLGHRAIWEAPDKMAEFIAAFLLRKLP
jgi:pimeloyl-ACP methyl ester carboxylesterase